MSLGTDSTLPPPPLPKVTHRVYKYDRPLFGDQPVKGTSYVIEHVPGVFSIEDWDPEDPLPVGRAQLFLTAETALEALRAD